MELVIIDPRTTEVSVAVSVCNRRQPDITTTIDKTSTSCHFFLSFTSK
jgi:hypothetical protein